MPNTESVTKYPRTAYMLMQAYFRMIEAQPRTKAHAVAQAEYRGMCKAIDRLGYAPTETAVELAVIAAARASGERPAVRSLVREGETRQAFDNKFCSYVMHELGWS